MATKAKPSTIRERVYLTFPQAMINEPVLSLLAKRFDVVFNIKGSTVTSEMALVSLELDGKQREVAKSITWLKSKGVIVEPIGKNVIK
ncbi:MAG TPA: NIL domain-containing protein [Candidatus Binatus sp.]|nr:NIL domain-containing protein [Candidatus Binatus sp.]